MQKVSKRQVLRKASKLYEDNQRMRKEGGHLTQIVFTLAVKLYKIVPDDPYFTGDNFTPEFLEAIKKGAEEKPKGFPLEGESQSHKDATPESAPERGISIEKAS